MTTTPGLSAFLSLLVLWADAFAGASQAHAVEILGACSGSTYEARAKEVQEIVAADQADRKTMMIGPETILRDRIRRMRIGEIFGEGCLQSAADFAASALVYQHGNVPEHFMQTFLWAKRAVELGDPSQKRLMCLGVDRYLMNTRRRQLFASQATKEDGNPCWCLFPVEKTFPDSKRLEYGARTLADGLKWVDSLNAGQACQPAKECDDSSAPTPAGTIPGIW